MNLYLLTQDEKSGYDTYDSMVVAAENEEEARLIRPDGSKWGDTYYFRSWATLPENVEVQLIGKAVEGTDRCVILASFNAG